MATNDPGQFTRDLGYLAAFFDKLEAHGKSMGGPGGGRLVQLIGEERQRWEEIKSLLSGAAPTADLRTPPARTSPQPAAAAPAETKPVRSFTVGSLRNRPK